MCAPTDFHAIECFLFGLFKTLDVGSRSALTSAGYGNYNGNVLPNGAVFAEETDLLVGEVDLPLRHCPSSSSSLSMTKGGARAVTTLNTVLALEETAATDRAPPGQMIVSNRTDLPDTIPTLFHLTLDELGSTNDKIKIMIN